MESTYLKIKIIPPAVGAQFYVTNRIYFNVVQINYFDVLAYRNDIYLVSQQT